MQHLYKAADDQLPENIRGGKNLKNSTDHKRTDFRKFDNLSAENRDSAVQMVDTSLTEHGIDFEQKHRLELLLEKTLLAYSENDKNAPLRIITHRTYKKISVMVFIKCA